MYIDEPLRKYLDDLAARRPMPGGGSAAALAASAGISLMCMTVNYTIGKPKYKNFQDKMRTLLVKLEEFRHKMQGLIDEDVEAYGKVSKIVKESGKDSPRLESAYKEATDVPFQICRISSECLRLCDLLATEGNRNLITDVAIAAIMLEGAFISAKFNVYENLKYIKDMEFIGEIHNVLSPLEEELPKLKTEILEKCEDAVSR